MDWTKSTRSLEALIPAMKDKVIQVMDKTQDYGIDLLGIDTYRSPFDQARMYRKTRSRQEIEEKMDSLSYRGFPRLAAILEKVGPQQGEYGKHITWAGPGESWHQFGEAWDACPMFDSKRLLWEIDFGSVEYTRARLMWQTYGKCVRFSGLVWAGDWVHFKEYPHCQLRASDSPLATLPTEEVEQWGSEHNWW